MSCGASLRDSRGRLSPHLADAEYLPSTLTPNDRQGRLEVMVVACALGASIPASSYPKHNLFCADSGVGLLNRSDMRTPGKRPGDKGNLRLAKGTLEETE